VGTLSSRRKRKVVGRGETHGDGEPYPWKGRRNECVPRKWITSEVPEHTRSRGAADLTRSKNGEGNARLGKTLIACPDCRLGTHLREHYPQGNLSFRRGKGVRSKKKKE